MIGGTGSQQFLSSGQLRSLGRWLTVLLILLSTSPLSASLVQARTPPPAAPAYAEQEAQEIDRMLMCPVCPAESIDQAQVPLARQMRRRVREMLSAGAERQEILDYFASRYGQNVLASPPKSGVSLLAWVLPVAGVAAALAAGLVVIRAMTVRNPAAVPTEGQFAPAPEELTPYLEAVDRSLARPSRQGGEVDQFPGDDGRKPEQ